MLIQGNWHSEGSAAQSRASLRSSNGLFTVETEHGVSICGKLEEIEVSDRLGNVERKLVLEDGSVFATGDNKAIDRLFQQHKKVNIVIHSIESHMGWVTIALIATVIFSVSFFKWGIPWTSAQIAHALPHKTNELIGEGSLDFLDKYVMEKSELDSKIIKQIRTRFESTLITLEKNNPDINYQLHFRKWSSGKIGIPNALALPSGDIILTDKFVELAKNQDEIDSVLLHEIGHVVNRHSLEMVIEGTIVTTAVMLITGDNSTLVDMGVGIGSLLVSSNYSREHESEADSYAFKQMLIAKIDPIAFSGIMNRMTEYLEGTSVITKDKPRESGDGKSNLIDYLSSHPNTTERIEQARQYSECFQRGQITCKVIPDEPD